MTAGASRRPSRETVRAAGWSVAQMWGGRGIALAAFLWIAGRVDPSGIGLFVYALAIIMAGRLLTLRGLQTAVVQRPEVDDGHFDAALWTQLAVAAPLTLAVMLAAPPLAAAVGRPVVGLPIAALAPLLVVWVVNGVQIARLRRAMAFQTLAVRTLAANVAGAAAGIVLLYQGRELGALVGMTLVREGSAALFLWPAAGWRPRLRLPREKLRELQAFGTRASALPVLDYVVEHADSIVIGTLLGPVALGYYAIGARLVRFLRSLAVDPLENVMLPALARRQDERERVAQALASAWRWLSILTFPLFAGLAVAAPDLVVLTLGAEWLPAAPVIQVLAAAGALRVVVSPGRSALLAMGHAGATLRLDAALSALSLAAFVAGTRWGILGVSSAHVAASAVAFVAFSVLLARRLGARWGGADITIGILVAAAVLGASAAARSWMAEAGVAARLAVTAAAAAIPYAVGVTRLVLSRPRSAAAPTTGASC